ncbi:MAG: efflux RND transporter permease subunit [Vicinamibacterales bacterium]
MLTGENSRTVSQRVAAKMEEVNRTLPAGVEAKTAMTGRHRRDDRDRATQPGHWGPLVIAILLGRHVRAAVITACVIPLSMLFTITGMVERGISGNLLSLGALDFDHRLMPGRSSRELHAQARHPTARTPGRLSRARAPRSGLRGVAEVRRATMFGELIIMIVYLPILTLTGIEGKMFYPMAFTVLAALFGAMVLSVTFVPAAVAIFVTGRVSEKEPARSMGDSTLRAGAPLRDAAPGHYRSHRYGVGASQRRDGDASRKRVPPEPDEGDCLSTRYESSVNSLTTAAWTCSTRSSGSSRPIPKWTTSSPRSEPRKLPPTRCRRGRRLATSVA